MNILGHRQARAMPVTVHARKQVAVVVQVPVYLPPLQIVLLKQFSAYTVA